MMSCPASATWSRHVLSLCCTEPGPSHGAVMSSRITTIVMSRSDQLGLRCPVEPNCSGMSACLVGASITRDRALDTCEPSYVPGAVRPFFYSCGPQPTGDHGVCGSTGALLSGRRDRGHVAAPEPTSAGR
jgi:hypothetical protein